MACLRRILKGDVVELVAEPEQDGAARFGRGEARPLVDHKQVVDPQPHALVVRRYGRVKRVPATYIGQCNCRLTP